MAREMEQQNYASWPADDGAREELATDLFGQHVVAAYDEVLQTAEEMISGSRRYKAPTEEQRQFLDWCDRLSGEDRQRAFSLVKDMVGLLVFSLLNEIDGEACVLREEVWEQLRVLVEIMPRDEAGSLLSEAAPLEVLPLNPQVRTGYDLHELWFQWRKKYSRWHQEPPSPPAVPGASRPEESA